MKSFIRFTLVICLLVGLLSPALAQRRAKKKPAKFTDHLWYGGGFNLGFSGNTFNLGVSPMVGYKLTPEFSLGVRVPFEYSYAKLINTQGNGVNFNGIDFGVGAFTRYKIFRGIFAHAEYNNLWLEEPLRQGNNFLIDPENPDALLTENITRNEANVGLGYSSGNIWGYEISVLYDVLIPENSIQNPWSIRVGVNYKF